MSEAITALSAHYRVAVRDLPEATSDEIVALVMQRLDPDQLVALAADGLGMGGRAGADTETLAYGFVRNFVHAMDSPDDE